MEKDIGHGGFCAGLTICGKWLEMGLIFRDLGGERIKRLCDH